MLKGPDLISKVIQLDGASLDDVISQCGFVEGEYLLVDEFYSSLSRFAESYITALSILRKGELAEGRSIFGDLLLRRLEGESLLSRVEELDDSFEPGPPWSEKKKIVIKCGYVRLTDSAEIKIEYQAFHDAYSQALEDRLSFHNADSGVGSEDRLRVDDLSVRIASPDSSDLIDQAAHSLVRLSRCISQSIHERSLAAIRIEYSGCGDDGEICALDFLFSKPACPSFPEEPELQMPGLPESVSFEGKILRREEYEELIKEYSFSIAYNIHGSWFNESGGSGFLLLDISSSSLLGCHYQNEDPDGFSGQQAFYSAPYFIAT